jgi:hypothetical protein
MGIDLRAHADLSQDGGVLGLASLSLLLGLFVLELAVIQEPADRRYGCGRHFYEVQLAFAG